MFVICLIELTPGIHVSHYLVNTSLLGTYVETSQGSDSDSVCSPPEQIECVQNVMYTCILAAKTLFITVYCSYVIFSTDKLGEDIAWDLADKYSWNWSLRELLNFIYVYTQTQIKQWIFTFHFAEYPKNILD